MSESPTAPVTPAWRSFLPGDRVVVRQRVAGEPEPKYSDVIGIVVNVGADGLMVRRDAAGYPDQREVSVAGTDIVAAKNIPPRPVSRRSAK